MQEGVGYPRNGTVMQNTGKTATNIILLVSYDAMPPYGSCGG